jgi:flavin reductase (DIM6/NTAB) family NADH-FMN oxidoreductase RutF
MGESVVTADDAQLRRALWAMTSGLYLLSLAEEDRWHFMTISLVMQVAKTPRRLAMSIEDGAVALDFIGNDAVIGLVFLDLNQVPLARKFAKAPIFDEEGMSASGVPVVHERSSGLWMPSESLGMLVGRVVSSCQLGSHWLVTTSVDKMVLRQPLEAWPTVLSMSDTRMHYGG